MPGSESVLGLENEGLTGCSWHRVVVLYGGELLSVDPRCCQEWGSLMVLSGRHFWEVSVMLVGDGNNNQI